MLFQEHEEQHHCAPVTLSRVTCGCPYHCMTVFLKVFKEREFLDSITVSPLISLELNTQLLSDYLVASLVLGLLYEAFSLVVNIEQQLFPSHLYKIENTKVGILKLCSRKSHKNDFD